MFRSASSDQRPNDKDSAAAIDCFHLSETRLAILINEASAGCKSFVQDADKKKLYDALVLSSTPNGAVRLILRIVTPGGTFQPGNPTKIESTAKGGSPAGTLAGTRLITIMRAKNRGEYGTLPPEVMRPEVAGVMDLAIIMGHELGHIIGTLARLADRRSASDAIVAVEHENAVRRIRQIDNVVRISHELPILVLPPANGK